jgi:hypothetical protein
VGQLVLVPVLDARLVDVCMAVVGSVVGVLMSVVDVLVLVLRVRVQLLSVLMLVNVGCLMGMGGHVAPIDG